MYNAKFFTKGKVYTYYICSDGSARKKLNSLQFKKKNIDLVQPYLKRKRYVIKISNKEYSLAQLIAKNFLDVPEDRFTIYFRDRNPKNCHPDNLMIVPYSIHGKHTGHRSRSQKVIVKDLLKNEEQEHRSMRVAAKALHVSYQTLSDYLNKRYKTSILNIMYPNLEITLK